MKNKLISAAAIAAVVAASVAPLGDAFAASVPTWAGDSSFTIVRNVQNAYGALDVGFTYDITPNANNPAGVENMPLSAAVAAHYQQTNPFPQGTLTLTNTQDLSGVSFSQAGDYKYTITETSSGNPTVYPVDSSNTYTLTISVRNNATLTGFVASMYIQDKNGDKLQTITGDTSEIIFASEANYTNIQITHSVSGNAADANKCFEYRLTFNTHDNYIVSTESTCTNSDTVGNGSVIRLKHGDTMTIGLVRAGSQIPVGTNYSITKIDTTDGYTTSIDSVERTTISKTMVATNNSDYNTANKTAIDEHLQSSVDTGIVMNTAIYILLAIAGIGGAYYATKKISRKNA